MGKVILCAGKEAVTPYCFRTTGTKIYTIEELCYYICKHVETVGEELFDKALYRFMRDELGLAARADYLEKLVDRHAGLKDLIVTILCSADYCEKEEIEQLLQEVDAYAALTPVQREKRRADHMLMNGRYGEALRCYRELLYTNRTLQLTSQEYGDILHNLALLHARTGAFLAAAENFREAYDRNRNPESLKQYLFALRFSHQDWLLQREMERFREEETVIAEVEATLLSVADMEEKTFEYQQISRLKDLKADGRMTDYYRMRKDMVQRLKNQYRRENS